MTGPDRFIERIFAVTTAGVLLAAGAGSRFEGPVHKLLSQIDGRPVVALALEALMAAGFDEVIVVTGAAQISELLDGDVTEIWNPDWSQGQATSLQAAVRRCVEQGHEAMVVGLGDQPGVGPEAWTALRVSSAAVGIATYEGKRGNPVRLSAAVWDLLPTSGDEGARPLIRSRPDLVTSVPCTGRPDDIDTAEDLARWN